MKDAVLRTDQVPALVQHLTVVADRIDRQWERDGADFLATSPLDAPGPDDPDVVRQRRIEELQLADLLAQHAAEFVALLLRAEDIHDATTSVAELFGVDDEMRVQSFLVGFSLFGLTRDARAAQTRQLADLHDQS